MDRAYTDARAHGWSREPIVELVIPSTLDDTLAPKGAHVATLFCQHVAPELPDGRSWNDHRDEVADLMIDDRRALRAGLQGERGRTPGAEPARPRTDLRPRRRRHLARRDVARSVVLGAAHARLRRLSRAAARPLSLRRRRASRRRRHRRARPQCRARDPRRPALAPLAPIDARHRPLGATRPPWQHPGQQTREGTPCRGEPCGRGEDDRGSHPRHRGSPRNLQSDRQPSAERRHRRAVLHPVDLRRRRRARSRRRQAATASRRSRRS